LSDVAAIVLAAGRGSRFGAEPKMLARFEGVALVRRAAEAALGGGGSPVLVVVGHRATDVRVALEGLDVRIVENSAYADGLSTSLRAGFAALPEMARAAIVLLGDMPTVDAGLVASLIEAWATRGRPSALVPTWEGRRGNPVVLSRALAPEVECLAGDVGAGAFLRGRADVVEWPVDDPAVALDVDTAEALAQASTTPSRMAP